MTQVEGIVFNQTGYPRVVSKYWKPTGIPVGRDEVTPLIFVWRVTEQVKILTPEFTAVWYWPVAEIETPVQVPKPGIDPHVTP